MRKEFKVNFLRKLTLQEILQFVSQASAYKSEIYLSKNDFKVSGKSILSSALFISSLKLFNKAYSTHRKVCKII